MPKEEEFEPLELWEIKIPQYYKQVSDIQKKVYKFFGLKKDTKLECVQKAYDILAQFQNDSEVPNKRLDDVLRYLGEALED
jgi:hypothetical protein